MPVETRVDGDPNSLEATARWLRSGLATGVDSTVTAMHRAERDASSSWRGEAGPAFQSRMRAGGQKADGLRVDVERAAGSFSTYADELSTAQAGMERARQIASGAGLQVSGTLIMEPVSVPAVPALSAQQAADPAAVRSYNAGMAALTDYQRKADAYNLAAAQATKSRNALEAAKTVLGNVVDDLRTKPVLQASDLTNGVVGALAEAHASALKGQSKWLLEESKAATQRYLSSPGGSAASKAWNAESYQKWLDADEFARRGRVAGRFAGKMPIIGIGITAAGIGYDIHQGKPTGKAILSGVGGALAATGTGMAVGGAIGGPPGLVVGAVVGFGAGVVTSGVIDWGYDQLPTGLQNGIESGFDAVGDGIGDAAGAVGGGAKKVWNSIF